MWNARQKVYLVPKILAYYGNNLKGKHFALWGLSLNPIRMISAKHRHFIWQKSS